MKLYFEPKMWGVSETEDEMVELTTELLDEYIESAKVFEIINFNPQVIADLIVEFPSNEDRVNAMIERFCVTRSQALLALNIPMCETPLYFFKEEYYRQIERLKTLRRILQEVRDVKDE